MDKLTVDTSKGNGSEAWMTLLALMLHAAQHPQALDGATGLTVDWWQHVEIKYADVASAQAAEGTFANTSFAHGSVLNLRKPLLTCSLRGLADDWMFAHKPDAALETLAKHYPAGVLLMAVDQHEVAIVRNLGVCLPPIWKRFGRLVECLEGAVRLAWLKEARV